MTDTFKSDVETDRLEAHFGVADPMLKDLDLKGPLPELLA